MIRTEISTPDHWLRLWHESRAIREVEALIASEYHDMKAWSFIGWCDVCTKATKFACDWQHSTDGKPNFRERLDCEHCELNCRQRLVLSLAGELITSLRPDTRLYVCEQVTPFYKRLVRQFPGTTVVGSEFLGEAAEPGTEIDGIRHEDGLRLSFPDASFDLILSNDVLEHVPDVTKAFGELRRVIRPGGSLLATFPFTFRPTTRVRAGVLSGRIEHFLPPIYHGNPLSSAGSLVFSDFGWDVLETCKSVGFSDAFFVCVHDMFRGYLGPELGLVLHAKVLGPRNE